MELDVLLEQMYKRPKIHVITGVNHAVDGSKLLFYADGGREYLAPGETNEEYSAYVRRTEKGLSPTYPQTPSKPQRFSIISDSVDAMKMVIETTYGNTVNAVKYAGPNGKTIMRPAPSFFDFIGAGIYAGTVTAESYDPSNLIGSKITMNVPKKNIIEGSIDFQMNTINGVPEEKVVNNMAITREQAEALAAQAAQALQIVNEREEKFGVDDYKNGDIVAADIKWLKRNQCGSDNEFKRQRTYNYAFIKADGYWYSSGPRAGGQRFTWDELVNWLQTRYIVRMNDVTKEKPFIKRDNIVTA